MTHRIRVSVSFLADDRCEQLEIASGTALPDDWALEQEMVASFGWEEPEDPPDVDAAWAEEQARREAAAAAAEASGADAKAAAPTLF
jgi:hypothetical protein